MSVKDDTQNKERSNTLQTALQFGDVVWYSVSPTKYIPFEEHIIYSQCKGETYTISSDFIGEKYKVLLLAYILNNLCTKLTKRY